MPDNGVPDFDIFAKNLWAPFLALPHIRSSPAAERGDEAQIRDLLTEYCYCYDAGDIERVVALFTEDAVISNATGVHRGRPAIRANYVDFVAKRKFGFHYVTNIIIRISTDADEAVATSYLLTFNVTNTGTIAIVAGSYVDRLKRIEGTWRIAERRITADIRTTARPD
jgi:uncharacterized protein (TIGR02246 family)